MLKPIGSFIFITALALFAVANSKSRRDSEYFQALQANVSQELFGRALAWDETDAQKAILKRTAKEQHVPQAPSMIVVPLKLKDHTLSARFWIENPRRRVELYIDTTFPYILTPITEELPKSSQATDFSFNPLGVRGIIYGAVLHIGYIIIEEMEFAQVTVVLEHVDDIYKGIYRGASGHMGGIYSDIEGHSRYSGIFGLSYTDLSGGPPSFIRVAFDEGKMDMDIFAFHFTTHRYELHLGGIKLDLIDGNIEYHPLDHGHEAGDSIPWTIGGGEIYINGVLKKSGLRTTIDSRAAFIAGDPEFVDSIYGDIFPEWHEDGKTVFPCDRALFLSSKA